MTKYIKVITLGDYGVGKSSIILRSCENRFFERQMNTLGISLFLF
jgi:GTPase SAR1 family protein